MGREIRRVPPNWEHPKNNNGNYQPMFSKTYEMAVAEWIRDHQLWLEGKHPDQLDENGQFDPKMKVYKYYADWDGDCPELKYHAPYTEKEATWFQLYEDVSEGTPITPPFETKEELINYLATEGDFWGRKPTIEQARSLVETGWAPSLMICKTEKQSIMLDPYQQQDIK